LDDKWTFIRVPQKQWWKVENGELVLSPEEVSIREIANPAFIGRRIQHQCFEAETEVSFYPASEKDFAGLVCYQNEKHYFAFGMTRTENKTCLSLRCAQGKEEQILNEQPLNSPTVSVKVVAEKANYHFYYRQAGQKTWKKFYNKGDGRLLSTHSAGGFTGSFVGMYASGRHPFAE
jgi:xylan 1,4-beta-xylosidase